MIRYPRRLTNNEGGGAGRARLVWRTLGARTEVAWRPSKSRVHADRAMPNAGRYADVALVTYKIEQQACPPRGGVTIWRVESGAPSRDLRWLRAFTEARQDGVTCGGYRAATVTRGHHQSACLHTQRDQLRLEGLAGSRVRLGGGVR